MCDAEKHVIVELTYYVVFSLITVIGILDLWSHIALIHRWPRWSPARFHLLYKMDLFWWGSLTVIKYSTTFLKTNRETGSPHTHLLPHYLLYMFRALKMSTQLGVRLNTPALKDTTMSGILLLNVQKAWTGGEDKWSARVRQIIFRSFSGFQIIWKFRNKLQMSATSLHI